MDPFAQMAQFCASRTKALATSTDELEFKVVIRRVYTPTGTTAKLIRMLRDNPDRRFTSTELVESIAGDLAPKHVMRSLEGARNYGLVSYEQSNGIGYWRWA